MSFARDERAAARPSAARLDAWLAELDLIPQGGAEREGVVSRDIVLDGRLRRDIRMTLILDPGLGCLIWVHYAPPLADGFRKTYQRLLHWNDELPFVKFGLADEERITLSAELPGTSLGAPALGLALARLVAVCDLLADDSADWVWPHGQARPAPGPASPLLDRFAAELAELTPPERELEADTETDAGAGLATGSDR